MDLTAKVRELKELKLMADELSNEITAIEDAIKAEMTAQDTTELIVDVFKIRWTPVVSSRLDTTALKKELPDIAARFTKTIESRRFQVA
jgi:predicted phage-related endonuclease